MPGVVIIGSGISATIASRVGAVFHPVAYSASPTGGAFNNHHAIMRIKEANTATVIGCQPRKVIAHRMALDGRKLIDYPNIRVNNEYSLKVYGELRECSALHLGQVERYLVEQSVQPSPCIFSQKLVGMDAKQRRLVFKDMVSGSTEEIEYEWCISTIPMPIMAKIASIPTIVNFRGRSVGVRTYQVAMDSAVCQTLYVPSKEFKTYRMSLHDQQLIVEYVDPDTASVSDEEVEKLIRYFGLEGDCVEMTGNYIQPYGKINPISETHRKRIMFQLTDTAGVLSLGRYATWRAVRVDSVVGDAQKVFEIISIRDDQERSYALNKEALQ